MESLLDSWRIDGGALLTDPGRLVRSVDVGGAAAWQDLVRRGAVQEVFEDVGARGHQPVTPAVRSAALRRWVPPRTIVSSRTAAWVWGATGRPRVVDLICPRGRHRPAPDPSRRSRQASILRAEIVDLDGVLVSAPLRTALDVATLVEGDEAREVLAGLAVACGIDLATVSRSLELRLRWPGRDRARAVLASLVGGPPRR